MISVYARKKKKPEVESLIIIFDILWVNKIPENILYNSRYLVKFCSCKFKLNY